MVRPRRSQQANLPDAIKTAAWQQITEQGAAALSLRAIARQLGITAPAIYNHYASRDELVTELIADAFGDFGAAQAAAIAAVPEHDFARRLRAAGLAYRQWAVEHPQRYLLIFGAPLAGYSAPVGQVSAYAGRSLAGIIEILEGARLAGLLKTGDGPPFNEQLAATLETWRAMSPIGDIATLYTTVVIWSRVHGLVMFEISHQYPPFFAHPEEIYFREIERMTHQYLQSEMAETTAGR